MGMFDELRCEYPLPAPNCEGLVFQTKDMSCDMHKYRLTAEGRLMRRNYEDSDEDEDPNEHTGWVNFYAYEQGGWLEFRAEFFRGVVQAIELICDGRTATKDQP